MLGQLTNRAEDSGHVIATRGVMVDHPGERTKSLQEG